MINLLDRIIEKAQNKVDKDSTIDKSTLNFFVEWGGDVISNDRFGIFRNNCES